MEIETSGGAFWQHTFLLTAEAKPPPRVEYHGSHMVIALEKKEAKRWSKLLATDVAVADAKPASGKRDPREWERLDKALKKVRRWRWRRWWWRWRCWRRWWWRCWRGRAAEVVAVVAVASATSLSAEAEAVVAYCEW